MSTTAPAEPTCGNCRYVFTYADRLLCRRYPPMPKHNSGFNGVADTRLEYWCGEHKPGVDVPEVSGVVLEPSRPLCGVRHQQACPSAPGAAQRCGTGRAAVAAGAARSGLPGAFGTYAR